jgi:predicted aspartyl protease
MLHFEDGRLFSQGACTFSYRPATEQDTTPRIMISVQIEGLYTETAVDTGGAYLVCDPEIADLLKLDPSSGLGTDKLQVRGSQVGGTLHRVSLTLLAQKGRSLALEVTAFVPRLHPNELWNLPSFIGLTGCLEFLRFAVDPGTNAFYFGPLATIIS